jgi:hypothetical protein
MFVVVDGVRIARRGYPGTPQARTWVSLEPGWEVVDDGRRNTIAIKHNGISVDYARRLGSRIANIAIAEGTLVDALQFDLGLSRSWYRSIYF